MKTFLITIDTEGDNLWSWKHGDVITSKNAEFLERFQLLCNKYDFKPVYLTNYEMATNDIFVTFAKKYLAAGKCEIGMHLHAVNNPPTDCKLDIAYPSNFPFLIEYDRETMESKISFLDKLLTDKFGIKPVTHRAGRWATNKTYFELLAKYGYKYDCSFTPHIDWSKTKGSSKRSKGSNYKKCKETCFQIKTQYGTVVEIPMTIRKLRPKIKDVKSLKGFIRWLYRVVRPLFVWLRPNDKLANILSMLEREKLSNNDYLMFMIHSSELMPNGSPAFATKEEIDSLYRDIETIFQKASSFCVGRTIIEYAREKHL